MEGGSVEGFVPAGGWSAVTGREMAEGGGSKKIGAAGEGGSKYGREIAVSDGELLCQIVIEREFVLGVEVHRLIFGRVFCSGGIDLYGHVVDADEADCREVPEHVVGLIEVGLPRR